MMSNEDLVNETIARSTYADMAWCVSLTMTTFIPALTLPSAVFSTPAAAILLPVTIGAGIGYAISRESVKNEQDLY